MWQNNLQICLVLISIISSTFTQERVRLLHQIVNGTTASESEFPFVVSLQKININQHLCGASILNRFWVLTAAHCIAGRERKVKNVRLEFGNAEIEKNRSSNLINVVEVFRHEKFFTSKRSASFDIAVLRLEKPLNYSKNVQPVLLPLAYQETPENASAVLIGWGSNGTALQDQLYKVTLQTFSLAECSRRYKAKLTGHIICAGAPNGGKGLCGGDSGGPLLVNGVQVGVVSAGPVPCAAYPPGIFSKVSDHIQWIKKTISDYYKKEKTY